MHETYSCLLAARPGRILFLETFDYSSLNTGSVQDILFRTPDKITLIGDPEENLFIKELLTLFLYHEKIKKSIKRNNPIFEWDC